MIVSTDTRAPAPRWPRMAARLAVVCVLPLGLVYCEQRAPTEAADATAMDPVEGGALDTPDRIPAAVDEYLESLSRRGEELAERIREAVESGALTEQQGRELSEQVAVAASGILVVYTPWRRIGVPDHEISGEDVQAAVARLVTDRSRRAELLEALQEMQEHIERIRRAPEEERHRLWDRALELSRRIDEASSAYLGDGDLVAAMAAPDLFRIVVPHFPIWRDSSN